MSADVERRTEEIPAWKREEVDELVAFIESYESLGVVAVSGIPSRQLQEMRAELHGRAALRMSRNTLLRRALETADEGVETLVDRVAGQVALIGTDENPFALYRRLEASKTPAPINAGEVAPAEIVIPEGDTGMDPGPFVGELQNVGAAAQILEGSIKVTADSVVAAAGEPVSEALASVLSELGIEPKEVGLDLLAVYADGVVFEPEELAIDIDAYRADVAAAIRRAHALSLRSGYPTARTIDALLARGSGDAKGIAVAAAVESPAVADVLVGQADARVRAIARVIDDADALPAELRAGATEPPDRDQSDDTETEPDTEDSADGAPAETDDEEDDDDGGDALGAMFG